MAMTAKLQAVLRWTAFGVGIVLVTIALLFGLPGVWLCDRFERNGDE